MEETNSNNGINNTNNTTTNTANSSSNNPGHNIIGSILTGLGVVVLVVGTIVAYILSNGGSRYYYRESVLIFILYEFVTLLSGFTIIGFGQILHLLQKICNKL